MRVCMQGTCCHTSRIEQGCARGFKHALSKAAQGFKQALSSGKRQPSTKYCCTSPLTLLLIFNDTKHLWVCLTQVLQTLREDGVHGLGCAAVSSRRWGYLSNSRHVG